MIGTNAKKAGYSSATHYGVQPRSHLFGTFYSYESLKVHCSVLRFIQDLPNSQIHESLSTYSRSCRNIIRVVHLGNQPQTLLVVELCFQLISAILNLENENGDPQKPLWDCFEILDANGQCSKVQTWTFFWYCSNSRTAWPLWLFKVIWIWIVCMHPYWKRYIPMSK